MASVYIIGGGASGLFTAINAARTNNDVTIIERNNKCGKKILITGNGRCNYWNEDQNLSHYHSNNNELIKKIINEENQSKVLTVFQSIGVIPKIKNGYYYPYTNQASSILELLMIEAKRLKVKFLYDVVVEKIIKENEKFIINPHKDKIIADKVVIATGSYAAPQTGSTGIGYDIAQSFGHKVLTVLPSLVQLQGKEKYFKNWDGIRSDTELFLYENGKLIKKERGEIQLTNYGISGICTFNISSFVARGLDTKKEEIIHINFIPDLCNVNTDNFIKLMDSRNKKLENRNLKDLLTGLLNQKLIEVLLKKSNVDSNIYWNKLTIEEKNVIAKNIVDFEIMITGTNSFDRSQVCIGGIPLAEINLSTMESLKEKNLYFVGEILDVDGDCGGYNLSFAWITGMLAGTSIKEQI